ncbi:putative endoglucanase X 1 [Colletotrichum chlorophyti]|uniref:Putative endoglucanase X 1 n=1 Tax=Colletotrichum chlorophyti TaxID=708187 RepID=A0A1Q8S6S2_9PEZI|nr:putative endoglucanase X 1 [Colletotrichum chlorophyti]
MGPKAPLKFAGTKPGRAVKPGTTLRILGVGDSITVGFLSDQDGGDGNGYRLKLREDLSRDRVVFAGTESMGGTMSDGYFVRNLSRPRTTQLTSLSIPKAAWSAMTIKFMSDHVGPSLKHRPNIVLVHAGTNDMNPNLDIAREGNDPDEAAGRLGTLIDQIVESCPDATVLVAMIIGCWDEAQFENIVQFQALIPGVVQQRRDAGKHVLAVDFTTFPLEFLRPDGIHPTNEGYRLFGDYWYDFICQLPSDWIQKPVGPDPDRSGDLSDSVFDEKRPNSWCDWVLKLLCFR